MQILIPMSGFGERFRRAGFSVPKPLIEVDGKPMIGHVIDMFPGENDFVFICNREHLNEPKYALEETLLGLAPEALVVAIDPHKLGPVHAVQEAIEVVDPCRPVVVNYCDFTCFWDWEHFKHFVSQTDCHGAIPAYRGFHPHSLGGTAYAYLQERNGRVVDIQEKRPFTADSMGEYASSGTYYFRSGEIMADAFARTVDAQLSVGGEYYVSLAYKPMIDDGRTVLRYELQHFMQWGTPEDLAEYTRWSNAFRLLASRPHPIMPGKGSAVIPMAGLGQRFTDAGYETPKPLVQVSGKPMALQALADLPTSERQSFVLRSDMPGVSEIVAQLESSCGDPVVTVVPDVTDGQAITSLIGLDALARSNRTAEAPITIGACDSGMIYDSLALDALMEDSAIDLIVWAVRGHVSAVRQPQMFGWLDEVDGRVSGVSVKEPLSDPQTDPIVIGVFTFRSASDIRRCVERLVARDGRVNNEFYLDSCITDAVEAGLRVELFEVDHLFSWGTPDELMTFAYWQSAFHKWPSHCYRLDDDWHVAASDLGGLALKYAKVTPELPDKQGG